MKYRDDLKYYLQNGKLSKIESFPYNLADESGLAYEVIRVKEAKPVFTDEHLSRLLLSLRLGNYPKFNIENIRAHIKSIIDNNDIVEGNLKIVIKVINNKSISYLYFIPHRYPSKVQIQNGVKTILQFDTRNTPMAKLSDWKIRGAANKIIDNRNVYETILVNESRGITEGSRSNVFFIKENQIYTAPDEMVLSGITRQKVIEFINANNLIINYLSVDINDLQNYDACFLTGTSPGVIQVNGINETTFNLENPIYLQLMHGYNRMISAK